MPSLRSHLLEWLLAGQALLILVVVAVPFGFDHPSSLGLDFGSFLMVVATYGLLMMSGIIAAAKRRKWPVLCLQVAAPCAVFALAVSGVLGI